MLAGIDYGSKLSGNTVLAFLEKGNSIFFERVRKKRDADQFILDFVRKYPVQLICIDAPLSLPGLYTKLDGNNDYFFRKCDRLCSAMSPMFLGGLTARAMKLKSELQKMNIRVFEGYPTMVAKKLHLLTDGYKKEPNSILPCLKKTISAFSTHLSIEEKEITSWHHLDALLSLLIATKIKNGLAETVGDPGEGLIYF